MHNVFELLIALKNRTTLPWAQRLENQLAWGEMGYELLEGTLCPHCSVAHSPDQLLYLGIDPQVVLDHTARLAAYLREQHIVTHLKTLTSEEQAKKRKKYGYKTIDEVKNHLARIEDLLAREPPVTALTS